MSELVNLEKRFENALEKLELALANNNMSKAAESLNENQEVNKEIPHNKDDLLKKVKKLEKAAASDAEQIDKLVKELENIFEIDND